MCLLLSHGCLLVLHHNLLTLFLLLLPLMVHQRGFEGIFFENLFPIWLFLLLPHLCKLLHLSLYFCTFLLKFLLERFFLRIKRLHIFRMCLRLPRIVCMTQIMTLYLIRSESHGLPVNDNFYYLWGRIAFLCGIAFIYFVIALRFGFCNLDILTVVLCLDFLFRNDFLFSLSSVSWG